jgi:hypothetical protein
MSEEREKRGGGCAALVVAVLVLLPLLYVLSTGPVICLIHHEYIPNVQLYRPLQWAGNHCEPFDKTLRWYVSLFV